MKTLLLFLNCLVIITSAFAQTDVDRLATELNRISTVAYDSWKVSPDLKQAAAIKGDPTAADFDDSRWNVLTLNQSIRPDSCWIRKEIVIPEKFMGQNVGGTVKLLVSVDDYGYMWIDGESKGYFPWDGEFILTKDAKPGQKFVIAIKAINTGGPLRLIRAEIEMETMATAVSSMRDFALSLRVAQKLLSFDTYQTNANQKIDPGTDKSKINSDEKTKLNTLLQSLAREININSLKEGKIETFSKSIDNVRTKLQPVRDYVRKFKLVFNANAHIDAAWLWRERETVEVCKNTFTSVLNMMDSRPDFTYTQSSAQYYDWMEKLYPDVMNRIKGRVKDGRWEVIGGMWIEPDCNLIGGESWMRQLLYAKKYFREKFGVDVKIGWNPDSFGYNWNMPQFYIQAGIDAFITQKIGWNEKNVFPYRCFWWESPDGSRILSYFPFDYVNIVDDPYQLVDWLRQYEANTGFTNMMILFGVGDHGGGPSNDMLARIEKLKKLDIYPNVEYGTTTQYLDWLRTQDLSALPVWKNELYLEYHQGTFTTQAKNKEWNRKSETLLTNVEKFSTFAYQNGGKYNESDIEEAWKHVLFNQFHDILPGSSIREVYIDAAERYDAAAAIGNYEMTNALNHLSGLVKTDAVKDAKPLIMFNALNWERSDIATVALPTGDKSEFKVIDFKGKEIPSQIIQRDKYNRDLIFKTNAVPSMGYEVCYLKNSVPSAYTPKLNVSKEKIENEFFTVLLDQSTGWIKSIVDKRNGKEILSGPGNVLCLLEDKPTAYDAWNIGWTGVQYPTTLRRIEVAENGPVRATVKIMRDFLKPGVVKEAPTQSYPSSFFTQSITLYEGIDQIFFTTEADWWEEKTMVKVAFPVTIDAAVASYEIPYGSIQRSTQWKDRIDSAKVEVPALRWADLSQDDYGVSLLSRAKYGYDIKGNVIRLSLLRSPKSPDPTADRGKHRIEYSLYPHSGEWRKAGTVYRGYEYNNPLKVVIDKNHKGRLPYEYSFVKLAPSNLILTTVKKMEGSNAVIYQWYDAEGKEGMAALKLTAVPKKAVLSNFLEEDGKPLVIKGDIVEVPSGKNAVVTVKVYY
jgi:alpha-mannosidase